MQHVRIFMLNCFYYLPNAFAVMSQVTAEYLVDYKLFC